MSIKNYIINNLKDCSDGDIKQTIIESIDSNDEVVLPGLGVLFEIVWNNCDENFKNNIVDVLAKHIK